MHLFLLLALSIVLMLFLRACCSSAISQGGLPFKLSSKSLNTRHEVRFQKSGRSMS